MPVHIGARLETVASSKAVCLNDISHGGASVTSDLPLRRGTDLFLHWGGVNAFATVRWINGNTYGLKFDEPLSDDALRLARSLCPESFSVEQAHVLSALRDRAAGRGP